MVIIENGPPKPTKVKAILHHRKPATCEHPRAAIEELCGTIPAHTLVYGCRFVSQ